MILTHTELAENGTVFASDCFDEQVGREVALTVNGDEQGTCTVLGVTVSLKGDYATFTLLMPEGLDVTVPHPAVSIAEATS